MPTPDGVEAVCSSWPYTGAVHRRAVWGSRRGGLKVNAMVADAGSYIFRYQWAAVSSGGMEPYAAR
jgi:hypothetical protein